MPAQVPRDHPLRRLFAGLVERTFYTRLGLYEPGITEYIANVLMDFVHVDNIYRIRDARGKPLEEVADMLLEGDVRLNATSFSREREVHRHIGDFTLFWSGVYPEALRLMRAATRRDHLIDYIEQGRRSYYIASTFDTPQYRSEAQILRRLSEGFEICMYGLNLVRSEWEQLGDPSSRRIREILTD